MPDSGSGNSGERPDAPDDTTPSPATVAVAPTPAGDGPGTGRSSAPAGYRRSIRLGAYTVAVTRTSAAGVGDGPGTGRSSARAAHRRSIRLGVYVAAGALAVGVGFGVAKVIHPSSAAPVSSAIPSPAQGGGAFVEDDNLTAQDNQTNILATTAPGLVHILSGRTSVGTGLVLTPSGKVLTTYLPSTGAQNLSAEYVISGVAFKAKVIGTDPAAGFSLLQMEGGDGRAFSTLQVGNSATLVASTRQSKQFSYHVAGQVVDTAIGTSGTQDAMTIDVGNLTSMNATAAVDGRNQGGLMESVLQSASATAIGGPLVNLNGQVIGITVAEAGRGLGVAGYAVPINQALEVAARIDASSRHS